MKIAPGVRIDFLRGSCLSRRAPAVESNGFSGAVRTQNNAFHQSPNGSRSFRPQHLPRFRLLRIAGKQKLISFANFGDDVRPVQVAAIGDGRYGRDELDRRHADFLPHGNRANGNPGPSVQFPDHAFTFPWQLDAGLLAESEGANVFVEFWGPEAERDFDGADVARLREDVGHGEHAESLVVVNPVASEQDGTIFAVENFTGAREILIESGCQRN